MSVGYLLYREVRDFAPDDWTHAELVVALMIADDANEDTRRSWIAQPLLCQRARLTVRGLRGALARLAATGFEFRVAHGYGRDGRPVFAARRHAVDYLVPDMLKGGTLTPPLPVDNPPIGGTTVPPSSRERRHHGALKAAWSGTKGGTVVPPLSSDLLSISSTPNGPELTGPVENPRATFGQDLWISPIEHAARQAAARRNQ